MTVLGDAGLLARAQLQSELRGRTTLAASAALGALGLILTALVAGPDGARLRALGPGLVWLGVLYGVIGLAERLDAVLREHDAHSALWLTVADRRAIYLGAVGALATLLVGLVVSLALLASVLLDLRLAAAAWPVVLLVAALGSLAAAAVGVLVSSLIGASDQRALLGPVVLLPLLAPTMLAGSGSLTAIASGDGAATVGWAGLLAIQAALFLGVGLLTFEAAAAPE